MPVLSGPSATFKLITTELPPLQDDQVLLKTLYLSNDPAQRGRISKSVDPARLYAAPVAEGDSMYAYGIAEVIESKSPKLPKGTLVVVSHLNWTEYAVVDSPSCQPTPELPGIGLTHFLGALGLTGMTAYYGLKEIARAGPDDTVVVSGAAGATGSMAVQIAKKMIGCKKVIGIAGTDEKCKWVESLGADVCINYKTPNFQHDLIEVTEGFVEVYFDNVGGETLDLMLKRMARGGRIAACGAISQYNDSRFEGLKNYFEVISMRLEIKGFIVLDFMSLSGKRASATQELIAAVEDGKIIIGDQNETVVSTAFEDIPKTWMKLFEGANTGKLITKLASES